MCKRILMSSPAPDFHAGRQRAPWCQIRMVRELVLPLAGHALREVWRPTSVRQSRAAAGLLAELLVYVPPEEPAMAVRALDPKSLKTCQTLRRCPWCTLT